MAAEMSSAGRGGPLGEVLAISFQEGLEHDSLARGVGVSLVDGTKGLPNDPVDFEWVSLDGDRAIFLLPKSLQRGSSRASQVLAHAAHVFLLGNASSSALFKALGVVLLQVLPMDLFKAFSCQVQCKTSP